MEPAHTPSFTDKMMFAASAIWSVLALLSPLVNLFPGPGAKILATVFAMIFVVPALRCASLWANTAAARDYWVRLHLMLLPSAVIVFIVSFVPHLLADRLDWIERLACYGVVWFGSLSVLGLILGCEQVETESRSASTSTWPLAVVYHLGGMLGVVFAAAMYPNSKAVETFPRGFPKLSYVVGPLVLLVVVTNFRTIGNYLTPLERDRYAPVEVLPTLGQFKASEPPR